MYLLFIVLLLGLNFFISWSNAKAVGRYWSESKQVGGSFRAEIMCGYIQAIFGFTMVYGYALMLIAPVFMRAKGVDEDFIADFELLTSNLVYVLVAIPIIGSGFRIWFTSLRAAWEQRSLRTIATAGWNSYAQIHNTISFARNAPSAFKTIGSFFGGKGKKRRSSKNDGAIVMLAILLVILALLGGYFTANAIMRKADAEFDGCDDFLRRHPEYGKA